jgi:cysteine desulfurase
MRIYLDHNATTPVDPSVLAAVTGALQEQFGNASSVHSFGQTAKTVVDDARAAVADLIGAGPQEIVFTSGGTESDNLAIRGAAEALLPTKRHHLIATSIEHEAVLQTLKALAKRDWIITLLPVGDSGVVEPLALDAVITDNTALVSVMHANNEIGTIQPLADLAAVAHRHGALFHTDAVQSIGKLKVDVTDLDVDLLSLSAHKCYGPKGVGALWVRRGSRLVSTMTGGKQERNRRAGTENVPGIAGLGAAARRALKQTETEADRLAALRNLLEAGILHGVAGTLVNGDPTRRIANTTNISFDRVEAESLLIALDLEGIAVSTGSACSSGTLQPSHVLRAMGCSSHRAQSSIRFSLGAGNTADEIERVINVLPRVVDKLRNVARASSARDRQSSPIPQ